MGGPDPATTTRRRRLLRLGAAALPRLLVALAVLRGFAFPVDAGDPAAFEWDITPLGGYPAVAFDAGNDDAEVTYRYNFTGTLSPTKYLAAQLFQHDCESPADPSALTFVETVVGQELVVQVDVVQETISNSVHYTLSDDETIANIKFCVRYVFIRSVCFFFCDRGLRSAGYDFVRSALWIWSEGRF